MTPDRHALWFGRLRSAGTEQLRRIAIPLNSIGAVFVAGAPYMSQRPAAERPLYAVVGLVFAVAALLLLTSRRAHPRLIEALAIGAPTVASLVLQALTSQVGVLPILLVWSALATPYFGTRAMTVVNLLVLATGMSIGVGVSPDERFSAFALAVTLVVCALCSASVRVLAERVAALVLRLDDQASRDVITGLLNRRGFDDALEEVWADGSVPSAAVIFFDLDHFKRVNDTYGHATGDDVLRAFAGELIRTVRSGDVVARTGGEEFGVLLRTGDADAALARAEAVVRRFGDHDVDAGQTVLRCTVSAGVAMRVTRHRTPSELCRDADRALYTAKDSGRDQARVAV